MAVRRPLVNVNGQIQELPSGDSIGGIDYREKLTSALVLYVRTDGSDSNNGLSDTSGGAFLTIQRAVDAATFYDLGPYTVQINVRAGTFAAGVVLKTLVGSGRVEIIGAGDTTIIAPSGLNCFGDAAGTFGWNGIYDITNMKLAPTGAVSGFAASTGGGGTILFGGINFAFGGSGIHIIVGAGGFISSVSRNYTISGSAGVHAAAYDGGQIRVQAQTVTLTGTPAFSGSYATAHRGGTILANSAVYSGSATGQRYNATTAGGILSGTTLPGNVAGVATSPGWYS